MACEQGRAESGTMDRMAAPALEQSYEYPFASHLDRAGSQPRLRLATSGTAATSPYFYKGALAAPRRTADLLLAVAATARTRYYVPPNMLARILAAADPVVTSHRDRLRFESFSACCGVYARLDLLPDALRGEIVGHGTTNVDFNPDMRAALAQLSPTEAVDVNVGADRFELERACGTVIERKVPLPLRWLKGFVEVQACQARMQLRFEVDGGEARRFLRSLPRQPMPHVAMWVQPLAKGLRLAAREVPGGVRLVGVERLRSLEVLAREAKKLRIYSDGQASAWELVFADSRLFFVVSPESSRGFSGEGQVLSQLAGGEAEAVERLRASLRWGARIDENELARGASVAPEAMRASLAALGSRGIVGYDLAEGGYFHRELPFDLAQVESMHPRLQSARELLDGKAVSRSGAEFHVRSEDVVHRVNVSESGATCTCTWYAKHQGGRGPCKHVLAVQLWEEANDS